MASAVKLSGSKNAKLKPWTMLAKRTKRLLSSVLTILSMAQPNRRKLKMRFGTLKVLTMCALSVVVSSCDSRVETRVAFPPVSDLQIEQEPPYPLDALLAGEAGAEAERKWHDEVLVWGRKGWRQNARVCKWAVELGLEVPKGYCGE